MIEERHSEWENGRHRLLLSLAWTISLAATLGSLFFSEVMNLPPCSLCWYQRIALFPLVVILATGILRQDPRLDRYAWPFVVIGFAIAAYHNLLYFGVISESLAPCAQGVSCKVQPIEWLGFLTIPLLSLLSFAAIGGLLFLFHVRKGKK